MINLNKVILAGKLERKPYMAKTTQGTKKALFTLNVLTLEDGATRKYIPVEAYGKNAEKLENLEGVNLIVEGKIYSYKSQKYDTTMIAISASEVHVDIEKDYQVNEPKDINYEISDDDLPF